MVFDKLSLKATLERHGYTPQTMSPEWCQFAVSIVNAESLNSIEIKLLEILSRK
jgi:hypothetical protein